MTRDRPPLKARRGSVLPFALVVGVVVALVLMMQNALAGGLARWLAGLWVSIMDLIVRLIAAVFGAG